MVEGSGLLALKGWRTRKGLDRGEKAHESQFTSRFVRSDVRSDDQSKGQEI